MGGANEDGPGCKTPRMQTARGKHRSVRRCTIERGKNEPLFSLGVLAWPRSPAERPLIPTRKKTKLEQAILFFLWHANNAHLGKTKLMKLLYFADFDHYEQYEASITGARYRKLDHGPVPDDAWVTIAALEAAKRIEREDVLIGGLLQHRYRASEPVDIGAFSLTELDVLYRVAQRWANHTSRQIEAATHGEAP